MSDIKREIEKILLELEFLRKMAEYLLREGGDIAYLQAKWDEGVEKMRINLQHYMKSASEEELLGAAYAITGRKRKSEINWGKLLCDVLDGFLMGLGFFGYTENQDDR